MSKSAPPRRGWTTGACAAGAARAAWTAWTAGAFPDPVPCRLPGNRAARFALAARGLNAESAWATVVKDAGDDPDVTHGARITATVAPNPPGAGTTFHAGPGVGTVTRPGLPLEPGEPAINPAPRRIIADNLAAVGAGADAAVTVAIEDGETLAERTLNPRLGIAGGLSVLGTTGVVEPWSAGAWIASLRQAVSVAKAGGFRRVAAATGRTSAAAAQAETGLNDAAVVEMGDFAAAFLRFLRRMPVPRLTLAGGIAKLAKLAAGHGSLHSAHAPLDPGALAAYLPDRPDTAAAVAAAPTAAAALATAETAGAPLADRVAAAARAAALARLDGAPVAVDVLVVDRAGRIAGRAD